MEQVLTSHRFYQYQVSQLDQVVFRAKKFKSSDKLSKLSENLLNSFKFVLKNNFLLGKITGKILYF